MSFCKPLRRLIQTLGLEREVTSLAAADVLSFAPADAKNSRGGWMKAAIDDFDTRILKMLQKDNTKPHREIAEAIGLSIASVARRIQRMRKEKIILHDVSVVDQNLVGRPLTLIVEVTTENERLDLLDAMRNRFAQCPQIQQCYYVTGEVDFVLIMNVCDMEEYTGLTRTLFFDSGNVKSFRTLVAMKRVKVGSEVLISV